VRTFYSDSLLIEQEVCEADVVVGAVLLPGGAAPKLVTREMVKKMKTGAVIVDVAIDQGGCFETSKPTTHADPTFLVDGVLHYCVANMPGAVARTSTFALTNATYPYVEALANRGVIQALSIDHHLRNGLNVHKGFLTSQPVAQAQKLDFVLAEEFFVA
jgi:alanine dehydrogenase